MGCFTKLLGKESQLILVENDTTNLQLETETNLTDCEVAFRIEYEEETKEIPCNIIDYEIGVVHTDFVIGDLIEGGPYRIEFEITYSDGTKETINRDIEDNLLYILIDKELEEGELDG